MQILVDNKFKNLNEQRYVIKFWIKFKRMLAEMKEILDTAQNESAMSQANAYRWYNESNIGRKSTELMDGLGTRTIVLTKRTVNIGITMILDNLYLTVKQLA